MAFTISTSSFSPGSVRKRQVVGQDGLPIVIKEIDQDDFDQLKESGYSTHDVKSANTGFPSDEDLERIKKSEKWQKIFDGQFFDYDLEKAVFSIRDYFYKDRKKGEVLKVCFNAPKALITKTMRFFIGGKMSFTAVSEKASETQLQEIQKRLKEIINENDFRAYLQETCLSYQIHGFTAGYVWLDVDETESIPVIEEVQYNENFPIFGVRRNKIKDWSIAKYVEVEIDIDGKAKKVTAIYRQQYFLSPTYKLKKDNQGKIEFDDEGIPKYEFVKNELFIYHTLHRTKNTYKTDYKKPLPLALLGNEYARFDSNPIEETGLDFMPIKQINNLKQGGKNFGASIIEDIVSLTEELQDALTRLVTEFIKHVASKMAVPASSIVSDIDENTGKPIIDYKQLEIFLIENGDQIPQYITKDTSMIDKAFTEIEKILTFMAVMTESPKSFLGIEESGGAEKVEALRIRRMEFLKKIEDYQEIFRLFAQTLLLWALEIDQEGELPEDLSIDIGFRQGLPRDLEAEARTHSVATDGGFESKETAMKKWQNIDGEELEAEKTRIAEEEEKNMEKFNFNSFNGT
ncbi:MAG: hypothetical protein ACOCWW_01230 [Bacteroidota bacterium]